MRGAAHGRCKLADARADNVDLVAHACCAKPCRICIIEGERALALGFLDGAADE